MAKGCHVLRRSQKAAIFSAQSSTAHPRHGRMQDHVTLLPPDGPAPESRGISSLPPDLLEQVRSRVGVLALILLIAFAFEPLLYVGAWVIGKIAGFPVIFGNIRFVVVSTGAAVASLGLLLVARNRRISAATLHM